MQNLTFDKAVLLLLVLVSVLSAAAVLPKIGMFTVARRRGLSCPWLAWLPFGHRYLLGGIADQYRSLLTGKRGHRKFLFTLSEIVRLPLSIGASYNAFMILAAIFFGLFTMLISIGMVMFNPNFGADLEQEIAAYCLRTLVCLVLLIPGAVLRSMVLLDYYRSCRPVSGVKYLILGLFFPFLQPIFQFVCRKDDLGMLFPPAEPDHADP